MKTTRREFLKTIPTGMAGFVIAPRLFAAQSPVAGFTEIRRGVKYFEGRGGSIGILDSPAGLVVVDTQFPESATECLAGLTAGNPGRKLDYLINTHHHGDHTAGNTVFKPVAKQSVAHANVPVLQRRAAEQRTDPVEQAYVDTTFATMWRTVLGDEIISARYYGPAHTSGDAVIHFENANVAHMGDLVFNRIPAYIDRPAGASVAGWADVLQSAHDNLDDDTIFIYGHGNADFGVTGGRADLLVMRDYLLQLLETAGQALKDGKTAEEVGQMERIPGFPDHYRADRPTAVGGNVRTAYEELMEKDG